MMEFMSIFFSSMKNFKQVVCALLVKNMPKGTVYAILAQELSQAETVLVRFNFWARAALTNPTKRGCGFATVLLYSGWY